MLLWSVVPRPEPPIVSTHTYTFQCDGNCFTDETPYRGTFIHIIIIVARTDNDIVSANGNVDQNITIKFIITYYSVEIWNFISIWQFVSIGCVCLCLCLGIGRCRWRWRCVCVRQSVNMNEFVGICRWNSTENVPDCAIAEQRKIVGVQRP